MRTLFLLCLILSPFLAACDRPFSDVGAATVEVISPDVRTAVDQERITLELRVTSVRDVVRVETQGTAFSAAGGDTWQADLDLAPGLNRFLIESVVDDGPSSIDTVDVLRVNWSVESLTASRPLLLSIGGHTVNRLSDGSLVLIGGSLQPGGFGSFDLWTLPAGGDRFAPSITQISAPRIGHTATTLPDGRILIMGGGLLGNVENVSELLEIAEVYNPATETFTVVPVVGDGIRRMYHTTIMRSVGGSTFMIVLGGRGDTQYVPTSILGIRRDLRTFEFRNDSLFALSPAVGPFISPVAGHTQTALDPDDTGSSGTYLVAGVDFEESYQGVSLVLDFDAPAGIDQSSWPSMLTPRIRHASVPLAPGYVAHFGGRLVEEETLAEAGEIHVAESRSSFYFPEGLQRVLTPAYGLTAPLMQDGRIALIGGFDADGAGISVVDLVSLAVH